MENVERVKVWDPVARLFHWTLLLAFATAALTEFDLLKLHVFAGYSIGALLVSLSATVITGLLTYGAKEIAGPFADMLIEVGWRWGDALERRITQTPYFVHERR